MITEDQLQRFFASQCTAEEAGEVAAWLETHPDVRDQYLAEDEWHSVKNNEDLSEENKAKSWQRINQNIKKQNIARRLKYTAVAACAGGCIVAGSFLFTKKSSVTVAVASGKKEIQTKASLTDTEYNYTTATRFVFLKDGSEISLSPQSYVWFDTPFANQKRDVHLHGEARFAVAKNKQKPFTVYAGVLATTALGTEFIVKQRNSNINVQLLHGKVVIKNRDGAIANWKNIYLLPGEQMTYNERDAVAKVNEIQHKKIVSAKETIAKNNTQSETADSLIFSGTDLTAVLEKLRSYYNVNIEFAPSDIKNISFTGTIAKKDLVDTILKVVTQMNGLSLQKTDSSFIITKNKN